MQQKCLENQIRFGIQVGSAPSIFNATEPSCPGKSGPAVPNVDGGIKVGMFDTVLVKTLSHGFRLRRRCAIYEVW